MKKQEYNEQERQRRYYFFDYLFWLGEITWENYHKVNFKQPRGSDIRKAVMQHYAGCKFSPFRRNLFFFSLYLLGIPEMVLLATIPKWITEILK